jgi:hypothetical protein
MRTGTNQLIRQTITDQICDNCGNDQLGRLICPICNGVGFAVLQEAAKTRPWRGCLEHGMSICWKGNRCEYVQTGRHRAQGSERLKPCRIVEGELLIVTESEHPKRSHDD